jgi:hypothetical protein
MLLYMTGNYATKERQIVAQQANRRAAPVRLVLSEQLTRNTRHNYQESDIMDNTELSRANIL